MRLSERASERSCPLPPPLSSPSPPPILSAVRIAIPFRTSLALSPSHLSLSPYTGLVINGSRYKLPFSSKAGHCFTASIQVKKIWYPDICCCFFIATLRIAGKDKYIFFFLLELQPKEREKSMCMYVMYVGMTLSFFVLRSELERSKEIVHSGMITASIAIISTIVVVVAVAESTTTITTVTVAVTGVSVHAKASKSRKHVRGR